MTPDMALNSREWFWLPVAVVALSGALQLGMPVTSEWLRLEPGMVSEGQIWRLLSGHLVHLSWGHFLMNALALLAICGLFSSWMIPRTFLWWMAASACSTGLGLLWLEPQLGWYVGLSGVLHGLLIAGSIHEAVEARSAGERAMGIALLVAIISKLAWEQAYGPLPGSEAAAGGRVIVDAHLYGALGGGVAFAGDIFAASWRGSVRATRR
jgi:rhomboid family GlyGly-CTERM serine protease